MNFGTEATTFQAGRALRESWDTQKITIMTDAYKSDKNCSVPLRLIPPSDAPRSREDGRPVYPLMLESMKEALRHLRALRREQSAHQAVLEGLVARKATDEALQEVHVRLSLVEMEIGRRERELTVIEEDVREATGLPFRQELLYEQL